MAINLSQDWIQFDGSSATTSYYGYAKANTSVSSQGWSIRQVSSTPSTSVAWDDNTIISSNAIWNNRVAHFTQPNSPSLTYSIGTSIFVSWGTTAGVATYLISVNNGNYSANGVSALPNPLTLINYTGYNITNLSHGTTYSVVVTASNKAGLSSSTVNIFYP